MARSNKPRKFGLNFDASKWPADRTELYTVLERWVLAARKKEARNFVFHASPETFFFFSQNLRRTLPHIGAKAEIDHTRAGAIFRLRLEGWVFEVRRV